jgi:membrane-associated phospholipid phosphatase
MNVLLHAIRGMDVRVYYFLSRFVGNPFLDRLARFEEGNYLLKGGIFFAIYWYLWFRPGADREKRRGAIIKTSIATISALIVARGIAFLAPFRIRPMLDPTLAHPAFSVPMQSNLVDWSAFPSDTAAWYFALAFGIMDLWRRLAIPIALYTAVWICLTRMYIGIHYASDIVAGAAIGIAMAWIAVRSDLLQSRVARLVRAADARPHWFYSIAFLLSFEMATGFDGLRSSGSALLHVAIAGPHLRFASSPMNRPIDEWGGFLAMAAVLPAAIFAASLVRRKHHCMPATTRRRATHSGASWPVLGGKQRRKDYSTPGMR